MWFKGITDRLIAQQLRPAFGRKFVLQRNSSTLSPLQMRTEQAKELLKKYASDLPEKTKALAQKADTLLSKMNGVQKIKGPTIYWTKVFKEFSKQIYLREALSPPNFAQIESAYKQWAKFLMETPAKSYISIFQRNSAIICIRSAELIGIFALGEMIGRRSIVGYKV